MSDQFANAVRGAHGRISLTVPPLLKAAARQRLAAGQGELDLGLQPAAGAGGAVADYVLADRAPAGCAVVAHRAVGGPVKALGYVSAWRLCGWPGCGVGGGWCLLAAECRLEVGDQVAGVFQADGEPDQALWGSGVGGYWAVGQGGGVLQEGVHAAQ